MEFVLIGYISHRAGQRRRRESESERERKDRGRGGVDWVRASYLVVSQWRVGRRSAHGNSTREATQNYI